MKIMRMLATASVLAVAASAAFAQVGSRPQIYSDVVPPDKGTAEIGFGGFISFGGDSDWQLNLKYLPYLNRNVQLGGDLVYGEFGDSSGGTLTLRADWNFVAPASEDFATKRTTPYVGLGVGFGLGDNDADEAIDVHGGIKHFLTNDVSVFGEVRVRLDDNDNDEDAMLFFGLNTYLR